MPPYLPPWWAPNGFWQTVWPALLRKGKRQLSRPFTAEALELPDGDVTRLVWVRREMHKKNKLAVLLPGLEGVAEVPYLQHMAWILFQRGFDVAILDHRGCGMPNRLFRSYHSGNTGDLRHFLQTLEAQQYAHKIAVGFSLGGNILLKYAGEEGLEVSLDAAAAIAPPFDLALSSEALQRRYYGLLGRYFLFHLRRRASAKAHRWPEQLSLRDLKACQTVKAFDDLYTAPAHGFRSADDYYLRNSCWHYIGGISIPTFVLHAWNDPVNPLPPDIVELLESQPLVDTVLSPDGGHMGFPQRRMQKPLWHERKLMAWLSQTKMETGFQEDDGAWPVAGKMPGRA